MAKINLNDWRRIISSLNSTTFEDLCLSLLQDMGFYNLNHKQGGPDEGRDIEAFYDKPEPDLLTITREKWFVECKLYSSGIGVYSIMEKVNWGIAEDAGLCSFYVQ